MQKSSLERIHHSRLIELGPGQRVRDIADACRSAALGFAWSAHHGWGRRELARWLVGPYARAASATRSLRMSGVRRAVNHRPLEEARVADLLVESRNEILEVLRNAYTWTHDASAARACIDEGLVAGIIDETSDLGYAPIDSMSMRLVDRVRSLFVADYLTRPSDYAAFAVCSDCEGATFDGALYHVNCTLPRSRTALRRRVTSFDLATVVLPGDLAADAAPRRLG